MACAHLVNFTNILALTSAQWESCRGTHNLGAISCQDGGEYLKGRGREREQKEEMMAHAGSQQRGETFSTTYSNIREMLRAANTLACLALRFRAGTV